MKIYFAGSIRGGRKNQKSYQAIIEYLKRFGEVLTEHIGDQKLSRGGETLKAERIFKRDLAWLKKSDVFIAEISTPSLGVGYEIAMAEKMEKKILCLFRKADQKKTSAMIAGNKKIIFKTYTNLNNGFEIIKKFLK